jgi:hypothetical protein
LRGQFFLNLLLHEFTSICIQGISGVRGSGGANCGAQRRLNNFVRVIRPDRLIYLRGLGPVEAKQQRRVQSQHQSFIRRRVCAFFDRLRLNGKLLDRLQRIDEMNAFI